MYAYQLADEPSRAFGILWVKTVIRMGMDDKISPEERLFKAIQEGKQSPAQDPSVPLRAEPPKAAGLSNLKSRISSILLRFRSAAPYNASLIKESSFRIEDIDLKLVNKGLCVILSLLMLLMVYYALKRPNLTKITGSVFEAGYQIRNSKPIDTFKPLTFYVEQARKRDIFHPAESAISGSVSYNLGGLTKDLSVAGIYQPAGKPPEAMIEDKTAKRTYFLKTGDMIKGIKVKAILKDRIILQYGEEEVELL